jgi:hypothetical protein
MSPSRVRSKSGRRKGKWQAGRYGSSQHSIIPKGPKRIVTNRITVGNCQWGWDNG